MFRSADSHLRHEGRTSDLTGQVTRPVSLCNPGGRLHPDSRGLESAAFRISRSFQ